MRVFPAVVLGIELHLAVFYLLSFFCTHITDTEPDFSDGVSGAAVGNARDCLSVAGDVSGRVKWKNPIYLHASRRGHGESQ